MKKQLPSTTHKIRCAIYTRKSSDEGLEMAFTSLDAQRDACERYITERRDQGWILVENQYDDGGYSGGTLERPALKRLLTDIELARIDRVLVYKIDRLSRSQFQFLQMLESFKAHDVDFVSISQPIETATPTGRAMMGSLMVFAQLEREMASERIRDKIAASRRRGIWMGGNVPLGYVVRDRKLVIHEVEAATVRSIFERFLAVASATALARALGADGVTTKTGKPIDKGALYKLLNNRVYVGDAVHKGTAYPGEHKAIISRELWNKVHSILQQSPRTRAANTRARTPALLKGLIFGSDGRAMTPTHTRRRGRLYRYYISSGALKGEIRSDVVRRVPASEIESAVVHQLRRLLRTPEIIVASWRAMRIHDATTSEAEVREALLNFDPLWDELFPAEQARIVQLLVERVDVQPDGLEIKLRVDGLQTLAADLGRRPIERKAA